MQGHKILKIASADTALQNTLSRELSISKILAQLLVNRGIKTPAQAQEFLGAGCQDLLDPRLFSDMEQALSLIRSAVSAKKKVMLFGDYDVDGITALVLLKEAFKKIGLDTLDYLPHRIKEGYGLNRNAVSCAREKKVELLVTADCGISNHSEIEELRRHKIEVIVTDHHEPAGEKLAPASAMINPKIKGCGYKFRDLAGVGVAYKLCQAMTGSNLLEELDLVALGTIADSVPLTGENRIIAKEGLFRLAHTRRPGIQALIECAGIGGRKLNAEFVSFILAPRINAGGRMDSAEVPFKLLLSQSVDEARGLAETLQAHNRMRQKVEGQILAEAEEMINAESQGRKHKAIVIAKAGWHRGVLGIVASKLADKFSCPTVVISIGDDLCKGSGRSIKNFHLFAALLECRQFLSAFGGHAHAVGLVIDKGKIKDFKDSLIRFAEDKLTLEDLLPSLEIDLELSLADLSPEMIEGLAVLEPFGEGNPEPLFYTRGLKLKGSPQLLRRDTLKFNVSDGQFTFTAIGFGMGSFASSLEAADCMDLVYSPRMDNWQGDSSVLLEVKDIFLR